MTRKGFLTTATTLLMSGFSHARHSEWDKKANPPLALREALELAEADLKNEKAGYYCVGATLANTFAGGDWELHFSSKEEGELWISIGSDRKLRKSQKAFQY